MNIIEDIENTTPENIKEIKLGFLLSTAFTRYTKYLNDTLKEMDISLSQTRILLILSHKDNVSIDYLSEKSGIGKSSVTKSVKILEKKEFITKTINPSDNRKKIIALTPKGRQIQDRALSINEEIENKLEEKIGEDEITILKYQLKNLITSI